MNSYPKNRGSFFAHKFCRILTKAAVAQELGPESCWLLSVIVHQEDAIRYSRPVTFWNDDLNLSRQNRQCQQAATSSPEFSCHDRPISLK